MALVDVGGILYYPVRTLTVGAVNSNLTGAGLSYDSDTDVIAYIGIMPVADAISTVRWRTGSVASSATLNVAIEGLLNGRPDGTTIAAGASTAVIVNDTDDNTVKVAAITTPPNLNAGDFFSVTWRVDTAAGTPAGNLFARTSPEVGFGGQLPLALQDPGTGVYAAIAGQLIAGIELSSSGIWPFPGLYPTILQDAALTAFNSTSNPNERALKIQVPFQCQVIGISSFLMNVAANSNFTQSLWPSTSSMDVDALGQKTWSGNTPASTTTDGWIDSYFAPVTLNAGDIVYIGVRPENTTAVTVPSFAGQNSTTAGLPGPSTFHLATRVWSAGTSGAWTDVGSTHAYASLIIKQINDSSSGGATSAAGIYARRSMDGVTA